MHDSESDLRMQNISEFGDDVDGVASDNATAAIGALGLGMANNSRLDLNSSLRYNNSKKSHKALDG